MSDELVRRIAQAILRNERLDFSDVVLKSTPDDVGVPRPTIAPVLITSFQQFPPDSDDGESDQLTTSGFEALSLAARANLLASSSDHPTAPAWEKNACRFATIDAADIVSAVRTATQDGVEWGLRSHGLQIVGARIVGPLDFVNCRLPFSIRLIGCAIDGAVRMNHGHLLTLDLSGSAIRGLFATYISCRSVRLRRTFSTSVVDFGGARIAGVFDASDCVILPQDDPPEGEAFVGDRGALNCSLAHIENEMRLNRARIYGGVTMKGTTVHRSIFMNQAIIRSPLAVLETLAFAQLRSSNEHEKVSASVRAHGGADEDLAAVLHGGAGAEHFGRVRLEIATALRSGELESKLLRRLLGETAESRISSMRANGAEVRGSIFARGLRSGGVLALKYLKVSGSVHLEGARLRSSKAVLAGFAEVCTRLPQPIRKRFCDRARENLKVIKEQGRDVDEEFAVDLRRSHVQGDCRFGLYPRQRPTRAVDALLFDEVGHEIKRSMVAAEVALAILFDEVGHKIKRSMVAAEVALATLGSKSVWPRKCLVIGSVSFEGASIGGHLDMRGIVANVFRQGPRRVGTFLDVSHATIDGDVDLVSSIGVTGVRASYCAVGGSVRFCSEAKYNEREESWTGPAHLAASMSGLIDCVGARIAGDGLFLFSRTLGPSLKLQRCKFGGGLYIFPPDGDLSKRLIPMGEVAEKPIHSALPEIDLRNASATVLAHPRSAWPLPGRLILEGFDYDRARNIGPLAPSPRRRADWQQDAAHNWLSVRVGAALCFVAAGLVVAALQSSDGLLSSGIHAAVPMFGRWNLITALVAFTLSLIVFAIRRVTRPKEHDAKPTAIHWLRLQQQRPNDHRVRRLVWPLQPFTHAAEVLRAAGRYQSANWVELERLRIRWSFLSWRNEFGIKALLLAVDWLARYGFSPMRAAILAGWVGVVGAMFLHHADMCAQIHPISENLISTAFARTDGQTQFSAVDWGRYDGDRYRDGRLMKGVGEVVGPPYPAFVSIAYAFDVMIPGFDLGQETHWAPSGSRLPGARVAEFCGDGSDLYVFVNAILKISGWLLVTAVAVVVFTRAEAWVARNSD